MPDPLMDSALGRPVGEVEDARGERLRVHQLQLRLLFSFLKRRLPLPTNIGWIINFSSSSKP